jgi:hypothetical protein
VLKFCHFSLRIWLLAVFLVSATTTSLSFAGQTVVSNNGQPLEEATVTFKTPAGKQLATAKTDIKGSAKADLPQAVKGRRTIIKVTDKDGNATKQAIAHPPGKPWHLVAVDTAGGVVGYSEKTVGFLKDAAKPITVGENDKVGTGARIKQKVIETASSILGGALGGLLGGGGGGSPFGGSPFGGGDSKPSGEESSSGGGSGNDIKTVDDPITKGKKRIFTDPASGAQIAVGTKLTPAGLLVSTDILKAPDNGTFQTIYLMDSKGRKAGPTRYDVYELNVDWKLTVSWTEDRYVNGRHVSHREGGWSEGGRDFLGTFKVPREGEGIWNNLGFSNAIQGVRSLGAHFPVSPGLLRSQPMNLVVHITKPGEDTVTTTPFVIGLNEDCPCATRQRASILDQLPSDKEAEELETRRRQREAEKRKLQERLRVIGGGINYSKYNLGLTRENLPRLRRNLDRVRNLRDSPDLSEEDIQKYRDRVNELKGHIETSESTIRENEERLFELQRERAEIEGQLDRLNSETAERSGPSIMDELEKGRQRTPCDCGTTTVRLVNVSPFSLLGVR